MRVALFGGTFDPPHLGHLAIAKAAAQCFSLDTIFFAPAGRQPLKLDSPGACFTHRLTMVALACAGEAGFAVSNLDAPRADGEPNYTVRTLGLLRELLPEATIFGLAGADSFATIAHWREPQRLLELAEWIVVSRPGFPLREPDDLHLTEQQRKRVHLLNSVHEDVAATHLRTRLQAGDPCQDVLPAAVAQYIQQHDLYASSSRST